MIYLYCLALTFSFSLSFQRASVSRMSMGMVHNHNLNMPSCQFAAYNPSLYAKGKSCVRVCVYRPYPAPPLGVPYTLLLCLCGMQMQLKWKNAERNIEQRLHASRPHVCACLSMRVPCMSVRARY